MCIQRTIKHDPKHTDSDFFKNNPALIQLKFCSSCLTHSYRWVETKYLGASEEKCSSTARTHENFGSTCFDQPSVDQVNAFLQSLFPDQMWDSWSGTGNVQGNSFHLPTETKGLLSPDLYTAKLITGRSVAKHPTSLSLSKSLQFFNKSINHSSTTTKIIIQTKHNAYKWKSVQFYVGV